jgi:hypothetical protein
VAHLLKKNSSTWRLGKANRNCFQGLSGKWSGLRIELAREVDSGASAMKGVRGHASDGIAAYRMLLEDVLCDR